MVMLVWHLRRGRRGWGRTRRPRIVGWFWESLNRPTAAPRERLPQRSLHGSEMVSPVPGHAWPLPGPLCMGLAQE